ncbi:MAG: MaoC/PaaZ C-terminal domain-containing protein [Solirubrobacteraceae bacterium]
MPTSAHDLFSRSFDELNEGDSFTTRGRTVTEADVVSFSALTGDWHPQHADAEWAASSQFGERVAHGMLVLSYAVGLVAFDPDRVVALRKIEDAVFKRPTRFGDTIHVEGKIEGLKPLDDEIGLATTIWKIVNQDDQVVARLRIQALWRADGQGEESDQNEESGEEASEDGEDGSSDNESSRDSEGVAS